MPGTIFFRDTRDFSGIDHDPKRCLLFKSTDTAAENPLFHLALFLPDGERFFMPQGDTVNDQDPTRPFVIPDDVMPPIQAVVNVSNADWAGHDNRLTCQTFMVPDGGTLQFDGLNYTVIPAATTVTPTPSKGCMPIFVLVAALVISLGLLVL